MYPAISIILSVYQLTDCALSQQCVNRNRVLIAFKQTILLLLIANRHGIHERIGFSEHLSSRLGDNLCWLGLQFSQLLAQRGNLILELCDNLRNGIR